MADKIRWGIISTARIGRNHVIPAIVNSDNGEVLGVASRDRARGRAFADELGIERAYGSYDEMFADPDIDAVYNPLPNDQHAEWSIRAARAGKHVLCEKPLAASAAEARALVDACAEAGVLLAEAFMYRFHPQTLRVREMIRNGAIGRVHAIQSAFTFPISSEDDIRLFGSMAGGSIMDIGCYCVGVMRFLTGEEPVAVNAFAEFNDRGADERATGILAFPSGVLGHFDCGFRAHMTNTYEIRGSEGRIAVDEAFVIPKRRTTAIRHWFGDGYEDIEVEAADEYELMVEDFAGALLEGRAPRFPAEDSIRAMELLDALRASAEANRSVVGWG